MTFHYLQDKLFFCWRMQKNRGKGLFLDRMASGVATLFFLPPGWVITMVAPDKNYELLKMSLLFAEFFVYFAH